MREKPACFELFGLGIGRWGMVNYVGKEMNTVFADSFLKTCLWNSYCFASLWISFTYFGLMDSKALVNFASLRE
jgi:hypothetical protein